MSAKSDAEQAALLAYILPGQVKRAIDELREIERMSAELAKLAGKLANDLEHN